MSLLSLFCIFCSLLSARPFLVEPTPIQDSIHHILPVFVQAEGSPPQRAQTHTRLDSIMISSRTGASLDQLLALYTPIYIKSSGPGASAGVAFRGTAASHTQILWNGMSINNPMIGDADLSLFPSFLIDRVELLHGGSSLEESSGALGGSIQLLSAPKWNSGFKAELLQTAGSFGTRQSYAGASFSTRKISVKTRYAYETSLNNFSYFNTAVLPNRSTTQSGASYHKQYIIADIYARPGRSEREHYLSLHFWADRAYRNLAPIMSYQGPGRRETQIDRDLRLSTEWKKYWPSLKSEFKAGFIQNHLDYLLANQTGLGEIINNNSKSLSRSLHGKYKLLWNSSKGIEISLQASAQFHKANIADAATLISYHATRTQEEGALNIVYQSSGKWSAYALLRCLYASDTRGGWMPSAGIVLKPFKNADLSFKLNLSRNIHLPTLNDLYWTPGGNPLLKPERAWTSDLSVSYRKANFSGKNSIDAQITAFASRINNWIQWEPGDFRYWTASNVEDVFTRGVESRAQWTIGLGQWALRALGQYAYTHTTRWADSRQMIYIPRHKGGASASVLWRGWWLHYNFQYTGMRETRSDNAASLHSLPSYGLHNLCLGKSLTLKHLSISAEIRADNITNVNYQAVLWRPMPGRNYLFTLKINY